MTFRLQKNATNKGKEQEGQTGQIEEKKDKVIKGK